MAKPRLGIIGCGRISEFHASACREAGFELAVVCSRPGSVRLRPFAQRYGIPLVFDTVEELLQADGEWDALLIAISIEDTLDVLTLAVESAAPILVEKPVAFRSADVMPLMDRGSNVIVGYNRRFYRTVQAARTEARNHGPLLANLTVPELVVSPRTPEEDPQYLKPFFGNTVHGLDLARFVLGPLSVEHVQRLTNPSGTIIGLAATLVAKNGSVVQFTANWGVPANFSLTLDRPGHRLELCPFEEATIYEGMKVQEPNAETPIRTYSPSEVGRVHLEEIDRRFKPGFVEQAKALLALFRGEPPGPAARLEDAYQVLEQSEQLVGQTYRGGGQSRSVSAVVERPGSL